jgi:predicted Zn-dependent peptidase
MAVRAGKLAPILDLVRANLGEVAERGITEEELTRAKGQMRGQMALSYDGAGSRMSRLGVNAVLGDERTLGELLRRFDEVTAEEIRAEAEHFSVTHDTRHGWPSGSGSRNRVDPFPVVKDRVVECALPIAF